MTAYSALCQTVSRPAVDLSYAKYAGTLLGNGVSQFLGVRYAKAPIGELRWALPQAPDSTSGVTEATQHGPLCLAGDIPSNSVFGDSEDCLFANIYTPAFALAEDGSVYLNKTKLPVYVWITGGGYTQLYNSNYNGTHLIEESGNDIIVITFNYRVGAFGFLAGKEVAANGTLNAGLMDQRLGGDPNHITLDGTSAGAGSVMHHLTAYSGRNDNLFQAGISDSLFVPFQPACSYYQYQYDAFSKAAGCATASDSLTCLRGLDSATLNEANVGYPYPNRTMAANYSADIEPAALFPYGPCVDGDFIADGTNALLSGGQIIHVPLLLGNDNDEGSIFAPNATSSNEIDAFFADNYPLLAFDEARSIDFQEYLYLESESTPMHGQFFALASAAYGESTFICPSNNLASAFADMLSSCPTTDGQAPVWNYRYAVVSPDNAAAGLGTPHTYQDAAYWGSGDNDWTPEFNEVNAAVIPLVSGYWTSFIKTYDPNAMAAVGAPVWEAYGKEQNRLLFNNTGAYMESVPADQNARCSYWRDALGPDLHQ
ncbi:MAG: hypothetical protein Q9159_003680 [Coniocarpon cinnabarinum]